jgi:hypothetical protein
MQTLMDKLEELEKALSAFKPKSAQPGLVPSLKMPTVKPLSMPSVSAGSSTVLPGVAPPSNKDPKKMAEQLKNPRPTKPPKIEVLKVEKNGQWSLEHVEKAIHKPDIGSADEHTISDLSPHVKPAKFQGGDPRHSGGHGSDYGRGGVQRKTGQPRPKMIEDPVHGKLVGATSGRSIKAD